MTATINQRLYGDSQLARDIAAADAAGMSYGAYMAKKPKRKRTDRGLYMVRGHFGVARFYQRGTHELMQKECKSCGSIKSVSAFSRNSANTDGLNANCFVCEKTKESDE